MSSSEPGSRSPKRNARDGTLALGPIAPGLGVEDIERTWRELVPAVAARPRLCGEHVAATRLFWARAGRIAGFVDLPHVVGARVVLGRHPACDGVFTGDEQISLRHLLALPWRDGGDHGVRLVDLRARLPMFFDDGRPHRSLKAHGPFTVRVGSFLLGAFSLDAPPPTSAPLTVVENAKADAASDEAPRARITEGPYRRPITRIESLASPRTLVEMSELRAMAAATEVSTVLVADNERGARAEVRLTNADLASGVLLGRAERCNDPGLRAVLDVEPFEVSRIHAVLIADDGAVVLYDCGSTNGTYVGAERTRSVIMRPGVRAALSRNGVSVELHPLV